MDVAPGVLGVEQGQRLGGRDPAAAGRVVLQDEVDERLADDHTDLRRLAGILHPGPARALVDGHLRRAVEHNIPRGGVGDDLLQGLQGNGLLDADQRLGGLHRHHLAVIDRGPQRVLRPGVPHAGEEPAPRPGDVLRRPAHVGVAFPEAAAEDPPPAAQRLQVGPRGGAQQAAALPEQPQRGQPGQDERQRAARQSEHDSPSLPVSRKRWAVLYRWPAPARLAVREEREHGFCG